MSAPKPLIAANTAITLPAVAPQKCVAKSTNGAFEEASVAGGTSSSTVVHAMTQMSAVTTVPSRVARGMMRPGSRTLLAGIVADSRPSSAQRVSVAAAVVPPMDSGIPAAARTVAERTENKPKAEIATSGMIFSTVVTPCTQPEALMP